MKSSLLPVLAALCATLVLSSNGFAMSAPVVAADEATLLLNRHGSLAVANAGPYVTRGTFRIQVSAKLGRPDAILNDGTWLYHRQAIEGSAATGTLVVRFNDGRVSGLLLATPAAVAALQAVPAKGKSEQLVATK